MAILTKLVLLHYEIYSQEHDAGFGWFSMGTREAREQLHGLWWHRCILLKFLVISGQ
jgi:hypothetical protein